jgi:membrane protein insertase Oxa1/YidC/SpoIIIJ
MGWIHRAWWSLFGVPLALALHFFVVVFAAYPLLLAIGPWGLAILATTVCIRLALLPLAVWRARAKPLSAAALAPIAVQAPLLLAMYWVVRGAGHGAHFLWIANLAAPDPSFLLPLLAALSALLLARAVKQPQGWVGSALIGGLAAFAPAAIALYWTAGNLLAVVQQPLLDRLSS